MTREELRKTFTRKQLDWLHENGAKPVGNTDAEVLANYARALWDNQVWDGKEGAIALNKLINQPGNVFDLQDIAEAAGFSDYTNEDGSKTTAAERLLDAYGDGNINKSERNRWKTGIYDKYGEGSWKKAEEVIQRGMHDRMLRDIAKKREDIIEGVDDESRWFDWPVSALMGLFTPRRKEALKEGRDPSWQEWAGDIGQSVLYALPAGKIGQGAQFLARTAPRGVQMASKILGNVAAQAAAPAAVVGMDQALGNEDYSLGEALTEAGIGTATNLGVNKGIARVLGPFYQMGLGKVRGRLPQGVINFLEGEAPIKEKSKEKIAEAQGKLLDHYRESFDKYLWKRAHGEPVSTLTGDELAKVRNLVRLGEMTKELEGQEVSQVLMGTIDANAKAAKLMKDKFGDWTKLIGKTPTYNIENVMNRADAKKTGFQETLNKLEEYIPDIDKNRWSGAFQALKDDPSLLSLFYRNSPREAFDEAAANALKTWGVNKYGSDHDAGIVLNTVGGKVKELRADQAKDRQTRQRKAAASKVLKDITVMDELGNVLGNTEGITQEDEKWLKKIEQNPGMVMGYGEGNDPNFKNWMLLRGSDLLKNTSLYRPAFTEE